MINKNLYETLVKKGINNLTTAQKKAIPKILSGKDILLCAPTGYGKTLAVMIPIFNKMLNKKKGLKTLYITPLRALNRNIFGRMVSLGEKIGLRIEVRHGDTTKYERKKQADNPPDMLITTPETLQAMLSGSKLREALKNVDTIIIDEIHELISSKRGAQLSIGIERLKTLINKEVQIIGLSATINNKKEVAEWLSDKCEVIDVEGNKEYNIKLLKPEISNEDKELAQKLHTNPNIAKALRIISKLVKEYKSIIFVNTRELAENISSRLSAMNIKEIGVHHSSLSKDSRESVEDKFRNNKLRGIISTSSLELGIDIGDIDLIIQFNSPRQVNKLMQRVGRAGHTSKEISKGIIITTNKQEYLESKAIINKVKNKWVEESLVYYKPLDVLAHQIVGFCIDNYKPKLKNIYKIVKKAKPYNTLTWKEFMSVIDVLAKIKIIFINDDGTIGFGRKGRFYYYENLSTIPDEKNYKIINIESNIPIGVLHEGFIAKHGQQGSVFICRAEPWEIISIDNDKVSVSRSFDYDSAIPSWEGELIPIHKNIAEEVRKISKEKRKLEFSGSTIILTTYFGSKINQTLAEIIAYFMSEKIGTTIGVKSDAYRIIFQLSDINDIKDLNKLLNNIKPSWIAPIAYKAVKNSNAFLYRFMQVAKRFGIIRKNAEFSNYRLKKLLEAYDDSPITKEAFKEMLIEKLDLEGAEKAITLINDNALKLVPASKETINELETGFKDFSNPKTNKEIMNIVKERLLNTHFMFYCFACGKYLGKLMVRDAKNLKCNCGSKLITFLKSTNEKSVIALRKKLNKEILTNEEIKEIKKLEQKANMFLNYGYMAPYAIAGRGVGVKTGIRILNGFYKTEEEFLKKIITAEKNFIKNKKYWGK